MKCSDIQLKLSLYGDSILRESEDLAISSHIEGCPICRQRIADHREIRDSLRRLEMPDAPSFLQSRIKSAVRNERSPATAFMPSSEIREWITMRILPYFVGFSASVVIGLSFLTLMFSGMLRPDTAELHSQPAQSTVMLAHSSNPFDQSEDPILPAEYVNTRLGFGEESPSVNPSGALIALTQALIKEGMKEDEVVVVADVYGNGLAQIAEVVEPSHDRKAIIELQKALQTDPAFAPFVPTNIESRPDRVRVVLKLQSVNVSTRGPRNAKGVSSL